MVDDHTAIRTLKTLTETDLLRLTAGYRSSHRYRVDRHETDAMTTLTLTLETLPEPYVKRFVPDDDQEYSRYCSYLKHDLSLGLFVDDRLEGLAICEPVFWNKTLWIWELHLSPEYQGRGLGRAMIEEIADRARSAGMRIMVCETQNTNVPAIRFYRSVGFVMDGVDLTYYTNNAIPTGEIALFMKRHL